MLWIYDTIYGYKDDMTYIDIDMIDGEREVGGIE